MRFSFPNTREIKLKSMKASRKQENYWIYERWISTTVSPCHIRKENPLDNLWRKRSHETWLNKLYKLQVNDLICTWCWFAARVVEKMKGVLRTTQFEKPLALSLPFFHYYLFNSDTIICQIKIIFKFSQLYLSKASDANSIFIK